MIVNTKGTVGEISEELRELLVYLDEGRATGDYTRQLDAIIRIPEAVAQGLKRFVSDNEKNNKLEDMMRLLRRWCAMAEKPVVLIIDEVDSATNNQVFLDFLRKRGWNAGCPADHGAFY